MPGMRVGILSDTHGMLRPVVLERLRGCDILLHAGDVGQLEILETLKQIAPVQAVRGNTDYGTGLMDLPESIEGEIGGLPYGMIHQRDHIPDIWPRRHTLIVYGHSHRPELEWRGKCLLLNPGAAGARRFHLPLTVAAVTVRDGRLIPEILALE